MSDADDARVSVDAVARKSTNEEVEQKISTITAIIPPSASSELLTAAPISPGYPLTPNK